MSEDRKDQLKKEYFERNVRWTDKSLGQLSFYNNLLLTLSTGFLSFSFNHDRFKGIHFELNEINWSVTFLSLSLILVGMSILIGLFLVINRLKDFRLTRQVNQIRQRMYEHSNSKLDEETPDRFDFWRRITLVFENYPTITIEECKKYKHLEAKEKQTIKCKFKELRAIAHNLGFSTWQMTKLQTIYFGLTILTFLASNLLN